MGSILGLVVVVVVNGVVDFKVVEVMPTMNAI